MGEVECCSLRITPCKKNGPPPPPLGWGVAFFPQPADGNISWYCNNFNIYANKMGAITAADTVDINMDVATPGTVGAHFAPGDIKGAVEAAFSPVKDAIK